MVKMYPSLRIFGYNHYREAEKEYKQRFNSYGSIRTHLVIHPYSIVKQAKEIHKSYELFVNLIPEILQLFDSLFAASQRIEQLHYSLPPIALEQLTLNMLINEIKSTNDIEGVRSTRKEINEAIKSKKKVRFTGIVNAYTKVMNADLTKISTVEDVRTIYDALLDEEIEKCSLPDGQWFRKGPVYIGEGNKYVHEGVNGEQNIIDHLNQLILYMNKEGAYFIKACVTHYFFEYVHPFYDGNGRMGRYLLSAYLSRKLDHLTGLSVSQAVFSQRSTYEKAFMEASNPRNYGELTHFVMELLGIISQGQRNLIQQLEDSKARLDNAEKYLGRLEGNDKEKKLLYILFQDYLFGVADNYLSNKELAMMEGLSLSRSKIDRITQKFQEQGLLEKIGQRPITYRLTPEIIDRLG